MNIHQKDHPIGAHCSIAAGLHNAITIGQSIDCTAIQIFSQSSRSWSSKPLTVDQINLFKQTQLDSQIQTVVVHASYLINIGSSNSITANRSAAALAVEIDRCNQLEIPYLVLHPGAHTGSGVETSIKQIAIGLDWALEKADGKTMVLLETMAGQGTQVGVTFEELATMRSLTSHKKRIGFCFDTCHVFSAGYDISTPEGYMATIAQFDKVIGIEHLKAFHINDSQKPCNAHVDRHAPLGTGTIPLEVFNAILNDKRFTHVPKILETPTDDALDLWRKEIKQLRNMIK